MLQDDAHQEWKLEMRTTFQVGEVHSIAWTEFVEAFNGHYFPKPIYQQKQFEFNNLTQGDLPVREYAQLFISLELFTLQLCANDKAEVNKFLCGLNFDLRDIIANLPRNTLAEVVNAATTREMVLEHERL